MSNTNQKIETLNKLRTTEAIYVLMSSCTRMPYVVCDPETFDDEILLYYTEAEAKEEAMKLQKEGNPMQLVKVDENSRLSFFTGLFPMGVNCILVDKGLDGQITVQLVKAWSKSSATRIVPTSSKLPIKSVTNSLWRLKAWFVLVRKALATKTSSPAALKCWLRNSRS